MCSDHGERIIVSTYLAEKREEVLVPYDWYHAIILAGAIQHKFPKEYISTLQRVASKLDPNPDRPKRLEALKILSSAGFDYLLEADT